jgi:predicted phosphodiesterase
VRALTGRFERFALFGGAYSNWRAVDAVVADARAQGAEAVVFLGDCGGTGPHPDRTVERLVEHDLPCVQGNYDDSIGHDRDDCACGYTDPRDNAFAALSYAYTRANTSATSRAFLRAMPTSARIEIGPLRALLCHGSPRRQNEFLWESLTPAGFTDRLCTEFDTDLVLCTHTGLHWERRLADGRGIVNVGAAGRPAHDGHPHGWYALLSWDGRRVTTEFRPVRYDSDALIAEMRAERLPEEFVQTVRTGWWTTCLECLPGRERRRNRP